MCGQNVPVRPSQSERDVLHQLMHLAMCARLETGRYCANPRIGGGALLQKIRHIMIAEQWNHLTVAGFKSIPCGERTEEPDQSIVGHVPVVADIAQQDHTVSVLALRHPTNQRQQICFRMQVADEQCAHQIVAPRVGRMPMSGVVNAIRPLLTMRMAVWMRFSLPSVYQATYCPPSVMTRTGWFMSSAFRRRTTATP